MPKGNPLPKTAEPRELVYSRLPKSVRSRIQAHVRHDRSWNDLAVQAFSEFADRLDSLNANASVK